MSEGAVALGDAEDRSEGPAEVDQEVTTSDSVSDADSPAEVSEASEGDEPASAVEEEPLEQPDSEPVPEQTPEPEPEQTPETEQTSEQTSEPGPKQTPELEQAEQSEPEPEQSAQLEQSEPEPEQLEQSEPGLEQSPELEQAEQSEQPEPEQAELDGVSVQTTSESENAMVSDTEAATNGAWKWLLSAVAVIALMAIGVVAGMWFFGRDEPTNAVAGDCLAKDGIDQVDGSVKIVRCDTSTAKYKVIGRLENQPESEASATSTLCQQYSGTEFIFWEGVRGKKGTVLCLATNTTSTANE